MSRKLNAVLPDETWEALEQIAERELRTKSQMAAILLSEAIAEYWKRKPPESVEDAPAPKAPTTKAPTKAKPTATAKAKRTNDSKGAN